MTQIAQSISEDFEKNLKTLDGKVLETYTNQKFKIDIRSKTVEVTPLSTGKLRSIGKENILEAYNYLRQGDVIEGVGSGDKSIRGLGFSETNPAYVWTILNNFDDIETESKKLNYKKPENDQIPINTEFIKYPTKLKEEPSVSKVHTKSIAVTSAYGYKGAAIQYKVKVENPTSEPVGDIKVHLFVPDVFILAEKEKAISMLETQESKTVTFEIRPTGECGECNVSGKIEYYDYATKGRKMLDIENKSLSVICPVLKRKEIDMQQWEKVTDELIKAEENIKELSIPAENLFNIISRVIKDNSMFMLKPEITSTPQLFNGIAMFYAEGVTVLRYAAYIEVVGGARKSRLILKVWAEKEEALTGFYHRILDDIEKRTDIKIFIDDSILQQNIHIGDRIGTQVKDSIVQRSTIGAGARKCPDCGKEVEANKKFCPECGARL